MKPAKNAELKSPAGTFYVADLKFNLILDDPSPQTTETYKKYQRLLFPLLRKECVERYPALFANDPASSIPLGLTAENTSTSHDFRTKCWMLGTLMIVGLILPCPDQRDEDFILKVGVWTGREDAKASMLQKNFRREFHGWVSVLTPLALIPVPGESDLPKASASLFNIHQGEQIYLQQLATQLATALAETIVAKDPEFWTAQPRLNNSSIGLPTRTGDSPALIPVPSEIATPF
jgi:hypothetical protein